MEAVPANLRKANCWALGLAAVVLIGVVLRLLWVRDMEYKADEAWTFERASRALRSEPWPLHGMPSSVEVANPGLSVWPFVALARLPGAGDPVGLTRAVQLTTVLALLGLALLALTAVPQRQREAWLWAAALQIGRAHV